MDLAVEHLVAVAGESQMSWTCRSRDNVFLRREKGGTIGTPVGRLESGEFDVRVSPSTM